MYLIKLIVIIALMLNFLVCFAQETYGKICIEDYLFRQYWTGHVVGLTPVFNESGFVSRCITTNLVYGQRNLLPIYIKQLNEEK